MSFPFIAYIAAPTLGALANDVVAANYPDSDIRLNDILVCLLRCDAEFGETVTGSVSATGWTQLAFVGSGTVRGIAVMYKVAAGGESGSVSFTFSTSSGGGQAGACMMLIRDCNPVGGIHASGTAGMSTGTTVSPASITTTVAEELCVACIAYDSSTATIGAISGGLWSEFSTEQTDGGWSFVFDVQEVASASTVSGGSATISTSVHHGCITFAVKPLNPTFIPKALLVN